MARSRAEDIRDQFCSGFFWGCEGDDPLVAIAFDTRVNPLGAVVPAFVGSDIGHWDVPSFDHPLHESYEQVEHGLLTPAQFEEFTFTNAVRFYAGDRPDFYADTVVESAATSCPVAPTPSEIASRREAYARTGDAISGRCCLEFGR